MLYFKQMLWEIWRQEERWFGVGAYLSWGKAEEVGCLQPGEDDWEETSLVSINTWSGEGRGQEDDPSSS